MMQNGSRQMVAAEARPISASLTRPPGGAFLISTLPPSPRQKKLAIRLVVLFAIAFLATVAFRDVQLRRYDAFVPIANTIICLNDVITAALLYAQFAITRSRALLALASGFLFKALMMIPHALSFPGAFAPAGMFGHLQTTAELYQTQHVIFLLGAIAYTLLRDRREEAAAGQGRADIPIVVAALSVTLGVLAVVWISASGRLLPPIMADAMHTSATFRQVVSPFLLLQAAASIVVFRRPSTSMIDLWIKVGMSTWLIETLLQTIVQTRFSLVFYASRGMGVLSSCFVLFAFLSESMMLHRRLVLTLVAREQEREGHRTAIDIVVGTLAHELRQPLTSILMNEKAASRILSASEGISEDLPAALDDIRASVGRANEVIDSVRTMFTPTAGDRESIDANWLVREAVDLMRIELESHRVSVQLDLAPGLRPIPGHQGQLLEVLLNGLKNAVDSFPGVADRNSEITLRTFPLDPEGVAISIEDTGAGFVARDHHLVFEPFYTTKPGGVGLGLSICQSIVSAHGGVLSLLPRSPNGAVLRIELPGAPAAKLAPLKLPRPQRKAAFVEGGAWHNVSGNARSNRQMD